MIARLASSLKLFRQKALYPFLAAVLFVLHSKYPSQGTKNQNVQVFKHEDSGRLTRRLGP